MALAEQRRASVAFKTVALTVRHPGPHEPILPPFGLWDPSVPLSYDMDWIWGAYSGEGIMYAVFICSPMHGFVNIVKAYASPDAPSGWFLKVLREAVRESAERGFAGFYMVTDGSGIEGKMVRLVKRHAKALGAVVYPFSGVAICGLVKKGMI